MRVTDKLTREEKREIESLLIDEMERVVRAMSPADRFDHDHESYDRAPVGDMSGISAPPALVNRVGHYQAVADALHRLRTGTYGRCVLCGNLISASRLLVIPETERCRRCGSFS
jgi:hypothetical protein